MIEPGHIPVLLNEIVDAIAPMPGEVYVDGTFGGGGYARAILEKGAPCTVLGIDRDPAAFQRAAVWADAWPGLKLIQGVFGDMDALVGSAVGGPIDGVVLDLGVSSFQIDQAARGFSFMRDGALDMRMSATGPSAADAVNHLSETDLANVIFTYGEERQSRRIARAIINRRREQRFETTLDFASCVENALGGRKGARTHPATKTFQALRIYVNDELGQLAQGLMAAERILRPGGRLVVVTFHSLEDRMVKNFLRVRAGLKSGGSRHLPMQDSGPEASFFLKSRKAIDPTKEEIAANPRSRSSRLRWALRTEACAWTDGIEDRFGLPPLSRLEDLQ